MTMASEVVFLLYVDNTLLNYDFPALFRPVRAADGGQETT